MEFTVIQQIEKDNSNLDRWVVVIKKNNIIKILCSMLKSSDYNNHYFLDYCLNSVRLFDDFFMFGNNDAI